MTKASQLLEKLLNNWPVKLICFIIAVFLYIFHQSSLYDRKSFVLPVSVIQDGIVMPVGDYTKNVTVTVRANTENITSIHASQIKASINLSNLSKNGEYLVPVNVTVAPEVIAIDPFEIKVKPESIKIRVEKSGVKYLKVEPSIVGEPAHGYGISNIEITPAFVEVSGPESVIEELNTVITDRIDISNINKDYETSVVGKNIGNIIKADNYGPFKVNLKVEPLIMEKEFSNYKVQAINLSKDLLLKTELPYAKLVLSGTVPTLENFNLNAYSVQVDLSGVKEEGTYNLPVKYVYPSYFSIVNKSLETVTVELEKIIEQEVEEDTLQEENEASDSPEKKDTN